MQPRRRRQFSLAMLVLLMAVVGVVCSFFSRSQVRLQFEVAGIAVQSDPLSGLDYLVAEIRIKNTGPEAIWWQDSGNYGAVAKVNGTWQTVGFSIVDPAPRYRRLGRGEQAQLLIPLAEEDATAIKVAVTVATARYIRAKPVMFWSGELPVDVQSKKTRGRGEGRRPRKKRGQVHIP